MKRKHYFLTALMCATFSFSVNVAADTITQPQNGVIYWKEWDEDCKGGYWACAVVTA